LKAGQIIYTNQKTTHLEDFIHSEYTRWKLGYEYKAEYNLSELEKYSIKSQMTQLIKNIKQEL